MNGSIHTEGERGIKALTESFEINCTFVEVTSYRDVFISLDSKSVDAGVVNRLFAESEKNKFDVERTYIIFNPIELRFAFHKNATINPILIEGIDRTLHDVGPVGLAIETRALFDVLVMGAYLGFMVAVGLGLAYQKLTSPEGQ